MYWGPACGLTVVGLLSLVLPARAQVPDTDVASPSSAMAPATGPQSAVPAKSDWLDRVLERIEKGQATEPTGAYPWYGTVFPGGWAAAGPGVRVPFGKGGSLDAHAAVSLKGYTLARTAVVLPALTRGAPRIGVRAEIFNARAVSYFGLGNNAPEDARSSFRMRPTTLGVTALVNPLRRVVVGGAVDFLAIDTGPGSRAPAIGTVFDASTAPGLLANPRYVVLSAHAAFTPPDRKRYAQAGGTYRLNWSRYQQRGAGSLSFQRVDIDVRHLAALKPGAWVLAARAAMSTTVTGAGGDVPYFLLPDLGGGSSLRSYPNSRFRDRHSLIVSVESRWRLSRFLDGAVFHDVGRVAATRGALGFTAARHATGLGLRVHTDSATLFRIDVAHGREGARLILATSQSF